MNIKTRIYYKALKYVNEYKLNGIKANLSRFNGNIELAETIKSVSFYLNKIDLLVDIGAHKGFFSNIFNSIVEVKDTICVEPNKGLINEIKKNNIKFNPSVVNCGLSAKSGELKYFLHEDSSMNSFIEANHETLMEKFPYDDPTKIKEELIPVTTLDNLLDKQGVKKDTSIFLKIDTQGNELDVLKGAEKSFGQIKGVLLEHMFVDAYKCRYSFMDLMNYMISNGFVYCGALSIIKRPTFEISSNDFLFIKK